MPRLLENQPDDTELAEKTTPILPLFFRRNTATLFALFLLSPIAISQTPPSNANGWYKSASDSEISAYKNGVLWSPVKKPTTIHRYFSPVDFSRGSRIDFSLNWESDGIDEDNANRELECSNANPTQQGEGISDTYLRCLAGTGDFRIGFFQSNKKVGNNTCEGNSKKTNCKDSNNPTQDFNDYRGFQFRIHPHLSAGYSTTDARLKEDKSNGESESHINLNLWSRIEPGENGLMSDECQAIDHCGFSKSDDWGTQPVSWGPNMPFGEARQLHVAIERLSASDFEVVVTMNGNRSPVLRGKFPDDFRPDHFDTMAITYTNSSRRFAYVSLTDFTINGEGTGIPTPAPTPGLISQVLAESDGEYRAVVEVTNNSPIYSDRDYVFTDLGRYENTEQVLTSNEDDDKRSDTFLRFTLANPARVHVLYDVRAHGEPSWLGSWQRRDDVVHSSDTSFRVYSRDFNAGAVILGGNERASTGAKSMYLVLVTPTEEVAEPPPMPDPEPEPTPPPHPVTQGPGLGNLNYRSSEVFSPISVIKSPDGHGNVAMVNGYLMVIYSSDGGGDSGDGGIEFWDVSDPRNPSLVKRYDDSRTHGLREAHGFGLSASESGDYLVAQGVDGIQFWDVSDPSNTIELLSYLDLPGIDRGDYTGDWWVFWQAPYVYVAGTNEGLYIVDAKDPREPRLVRRMSTSDLGNLNAGLVYAIGNLMMVMEHQGEKYSTFDISDPERPALLHTFRAEEGYSHLFAAGKIFSSGSDSPRQMHAYDVNHDGTIRYYGSAGDNLGNGGYGSYQDGYFFSGFSSKIAKIDVENLRQVGTGSSNLSGRDEDFALVLGNVVFAGDDHGEGSALIPHQSAPDTRGPEVLWVHPANGATQQALSTRIGVSMSDNVEIHSLDSNRFSLRPVGGERLSGKYSVQMGVVNFSPDEALAPATEYELRVSGVEDLVGNEGGSFVSRFTTESATQNPDDDLPLSDLTQPYLTVPSTENLRLYADRDYRVIGALPGALADGIFIQTRNDDKVSAAEDYLSFTLRQDADIFVLYDDRVSHEDTPQWLQSWTQTNDLIDTSDTPRRVYRKRYPAGSVTLGGNAPARSMYSVVVVAQTPVGEAPRCELGDLNPLVTGAPGDYRATQIVGSEPLRHLWHFDDGGEAATQAQATRIYNVPGRYAIRLTLSNALGRSSCSATQIVHDVLTSAAPQSSSTIITRGNEVFNVNPDNNTVTKMDTQGTVLWEQNVGARPRSLVIDSRQRLWVVNQDDASVTLLDTTQGQLLRTIALPYGSRPFGIVLDASDHAFISLEGRHEVVKLDAEGNQVARIPLPGEPRGVALDAAQNTLYVTRFISNGEHAEVYALDAASLALRTITPLANDPGPDTESSGRGIPNYLTQIRIAPHGKTAWVPSKKDNLDRGRFRDGQDLNFESRVRAIVSMIQLDNGEEDLFSRIDINDRDLPQSLIFSPLGDLFFVATQGTNTIEVYDANSLALLSSVSTERAPIGMVISDDASTLFVHNFMSRSVSLFDIASLLAGRSNALSLRGHVDVVRNEVLPAQVFSGKQIFYNAADRRMNRDGYLSCASCHLDGGSDGQVWDMTQNDEGLRNTITLHGKAGTTHGNVHWSGNFDEIQDFENDIRLSFGGRGFLSDADFTRTRDPLGASKTGLSQNLDDLATYVTSLDRVPNSSHRNPQGALTESAKQGKAIFVERGCQNCHSGDHFSDGLRHDVGTLTPASGQGLQGLGFKTPTLKGVWATAPYFHDGSAATIEDVLNHRLHSNAHELSATARSQLADYVRQIDENEGGQTPPPDTPPAPEGFQFAHYRFENSVNDASGAGHHGEIGNRASYSTIEREGSHALKLDGHEQDYLSLPAALASSEDFTFAGWVRWHGGESWQRIFSAGRDRDNVMFLTVSDSRQRLRFRIEKDDEKQELVGDIALAIKRYYHIALTLKDDRATLYVDGQVLAQSDGISFNPQQLGATQVWLGRSHFNDPYFDGRMDDVRFYGKALSTEEIRALHDL